ncbi:hypothetical protein [Mesorhizobium sp. DCY119]|uniref:hypothetical protein n=1 Tax=Mesorhizobium sp. DCY119 TaxID=2108445 RepID=UPI0014040D3B|nr:hypothetical protein [Mesorhizobium sp. DCY119]
MRIVLSARMMVVKDRIQREGEVVHFVAHQLKDLTKKFATVGEQETAFPLPHGRGEPF